MEDAGRGPRSSWSFTKADGFPVPLTSASRRDGTTNGTLYNLVAAAVYTSRPGKYPRGSKRRGKEMYDLGLTAEIVRSDGRPDLPHGWPI